MNAADRLMGVIGLRVPGALAYRHLAIRLVSTACKIALESDSDGADRDFEPEVVSAFGEAFNNIAVHGYAGMAAEPVQIEVDWDEERLVVTMIDSGRTYDPATIAAPDLDELPERGMGLFIMASCMDEVDYRPGPPNVLRMVKRRRRREGTLPPDADGGERGSGVPPIAGPRSPRSGLPPIEGGAGERIASAAGAGRDDWRTRSASADDAAAEASRQE